MTWFGLLTALVKMVAAFIDYANTNKLLKAGEAQALSKQLEDVNERVRKAIEARKAVRDSIDANPGSVFDDDGYRRD